MFFKVSLVHTAFTSLLYTTKANKNNKTHGLYEKEDLTEEKIFENYLFT